jgi:hypothetical protein
MLMIREFPEHEAEKLPRRLIGDVNDRQLVYGAMILSESALRKVWDNPKDAAYDDL